ncbi:MAG TPA: ATP-dependent DNA helicase [Chloroflexota bacterium]|nr:ATP-dependent DNA helicase [Chloroflexota bacterium]
MSAREPNAEQARVVAHGTGPVRIMAGAGTGKTFTITERVTRLIRDGLARPDQILALTFTNKAAAEMGERITAACLEIGVAPDAEPVTVLTYHSFGGSVLREWGGLIGIPPAPEILAEAGRWLLLWDCLPRVDFRSVDLLNLRGEYGSPMKKILELSNRLKDELATPEDLLTYLDGPADGLLDAEKRAALADYARALLIYEETKARRGQIDFGDQIALAVRALGLAEVRAGYRDRYRYVLVDEYQDTNYAQSVLVQRLVQDFADQNVCVVGDIRQAIYRFRGAAPDNIVRFEHDFPATCSYTLRANYRSTGTILAAANTLWDEPGSDLVSAEGRTGDPVVAVCCEDAESEWEWIARQMRAQHEGGVPWRGMAVLVRKSEIKRQVWAGLTRRGIPALMSGGTDLFRTPEVRELLSYLRALARPSDSISLAHIASSDSFGLDEAALYAIIGPLPRERSLFSLLVERAADPAAPPDLRLFLATFQRLLADAATLTPARVVERIIGLRRGAYTDLQRANVYRFHTLAERFCADRANRPAIGSFVAYLNLLLAAPPDEEEAVDVTAEDAVQVMTVHAAKGLEWPVVFVAGVSKSDFIMSNNSDALPLPLRHPAVGMPKAENFPDHRKYLRALDEWGKQEHDLEERRILYVALTRAQDALYLSWHRLPLWYGKERAPLPALKGALETARREEFTHEDWQEETPGDASLLERAREFARQQAKVWAGRQLDEMDGELAERIAESWRAYVSEEELPVSSEFLHQELVRWRMTRLQADALLTRCLHPASRPADADSRPIVEAPSTLSYSMIATYQACSRKAYLRFLIGFPGEPQPGATGAGTAFHAAVEEAAVARAGGDGVDLAGLREAYRAAAAEAYGKESYQLSVSDEAMLRAYWDGPDREAEPLAVEEEFYWRVGPGYLHGFIDRIQRCPDGTIELVDFKTSRQALCADEARQNLQLLIYALAAREVLGIRLDRLTLVYPRLHRRVSVSFGEEELDAARREIVLLMERARTASWDEVNTSHCPHCEYRLICPAAR